MNSASTNPPACGLHFSSKRSEKCTEVCLSAANDIIHHPPLSASLSVLCTYFTCLHSLFPPFLLSFFRPGTKRSMEWKKYTRYPPAPSSPRPQIKAQIKRRHADVPKD